MKRFRVTFELTSKELDAFRSVIEVPFSGDDDDVTAVIGPDLQAAFRMIDKVRAAIDSAREKP